jgi:hypothetical protein
MTITCGVQPKSSGRALDVTPEAFGDLRRSDDVAGDAEVLRARMREDGYLYLPGYLDREEVLAARLAVLGRLAADGRIDARHPLKDAVAAKEGGKSVRDDMARDCPPLRNLLYDGRMIAFYRGFLGGPVRHFDYTWLRAVSPGRGTYPHYDIVYMGRGTKNLCTAWTPLGDVSLEEGGLIILENSHRLERLKATYGAKDVDSYCMNRKMQPHQMQQGWLSRNPVKLREKLGGRWLTAEFRAGDLLTFGMFTLHASLDNQSHAIRLSSDSRYQLAAEPADERWVGDRPSAHSEASKQGRIC